MFPILIFWFLKNVLTEDLINFDFGPLAFSRKSDEFFHQISPPPVPYPSTNNWKFWTKNSDEIKSEFGDFTLEVPKKTITRFNHNTNNTVTKFTYIQKIPKTGNTTTKLNKINNFLKDYLHKLYTKKYGEQQTLNKMPEEIEDPVVPQIEEENKSKFFGSLASFKNKTMKVANKFLSLFTIIQFPNSQCQATSGGVLYSGACYHSSECDRLNGTALGDCAAGYGVCCVFRFTCGGCSNQNCTYFESPGYPNYDPPNGDILPPTTAPPTPPLTPAPTPDPRLPYFYSNPYGRQVASPTSSLSCSFLMQKLNDSIQQFRLDFLDFELAGPTNGICAQERLIIAGQNLNDEVPVICGYNTGQHMYVDVSELNGPLTLSVLSMSVMRKRYRIKITQIAQMCPNSNCLQYYTGVSGVISSFNYDQAAQFNRSSPGYFNNLNYAICIRKEAGYCSITYRNVNSANGTTYPIELQNVDANGAPVVPPGQAGAEIFNCPDDYIIINGIRLCGQRFNDGSDNEDFTMNAPVTDTSSGPIVIPVHTDSSVTGRGFKLFFMQNMCTR